MVAKISSALGYFRNIGRVEWRAARTRLRFSGLPNRTTLTSVLVCEPSVPAPTPPISLY
jgi:hypothetical protein